MRELESCAGSTLKRSRRIIKMMSHWTAFVESIFEILGKYLAEKRPDSYYYGIGRFRTLREDE